MTVGLHPKGRSGEAVQLSESLRGADDVEDAHAIEGLAEQVEAAANMILLADVSRPGG